MEAKSLNDFLFVYEKFAQAENKSPRTIEAVTRATRHFDRFLDHIPDVRQVTADDLRRYIRHLQESIKWADHPTIKSKTGRLSPHSIASYVRSIRSMWSWLEREEFIQDNPFRKVKVPKTSRKIIRTFSGDQILQFIKVIPTNTSDGYRDYAIAITLYGTGLRIGELIGLKLRDINFDNGEIKVMGKGQKQRTVFMSSRVFKVVFKYIQKFRPKVNSDYVFVNNSSTPLTRFYVDHRFHLYGIKAGITEIRCSPHTLRHTFAVGYLRNGGDVFSLQKILGHATLEMTRHYAELSDNDIEVKQKAFSPAEKLPLKV